MLYPIITNRINTLRFAPIPSRLPADLIYFLIPFLFDICEEKSEEKKGRNVVVTRV